MKKIYQKPEIQIVNVSVTSIIAGSPDPLGINHDASPVSKGDAWVKRDRSSYSVWDEDWSN